LSGSVSRGENCFKQSDIDFIILLSSLKEMDKQFINSIKSPIQFSKIDINIFTIEEIMINNLYKFIIKTDSLLLHGFDYRLKIKDYYCNNELINIIFNLSMYKEFFLKLENEKNINEIQLRKYAKENIRILLVFLIKHNIYKTSIQLIAINALDLLKNTFKEYITNSLNVYKTPCLNSDEIIKFKKMSSKNHFKIFKIYEETYNL
jgi:hypothetical protein